MSSYDLYSSILIEAFISITDVWFKHIIDKHSDRQSVKYIYDIFTRYYNKLHEYKKDTLTNEAFNYYYDWTERLLISLKAINPQGGFWAHKITRNTPNYEIRRNIIITDNDIRRFRSDLFELKDYFITKHHLANFKAKRNAPKSLNANQKKILRERSHLEKELHTLRLQKMAFERDHPWATIELPSRLENEGVTGHQSVNPLTDNVFNRIREKEASPKRHLATLEHKIRHTEDAIRGLTGVYEKSTSRVKSRKSTSVKGILNRNFTRKSR